MGDSRAVGKAIDLLNHVIGPDKRPAHGEDAPYSHVCLLYMQLQQEVASSFYYC